MKTETWHIVQRQESWHVLDSNGVLLVAFSTRAEGQAWVAGVRYGIDLTREIVSQTRQDFERRWDGATGSIERVRIDTTGVV